MANKVRTLLIVAICLAVILCAVLIPLRVTGIIGSSPRVRESVPVEQTDLPPANFFKTIPDSELKTGQYAVFTIEYKETEYKIKVFLLSDYAPKTVENFIRYADDKLYDDTVFYRSSITKDADGGTETTYLQGGAYTVNEKGELVKKVPDTYYGKIEGEFYANDPNTNNKIDFVGGTIGMVREENDYNSADTEYFFLSYANTSLNGKYAAFGTVLENDDIAQLYYLTNALENDEGYPIVIKTVRVYTR